MMLHKGGRKEGGGGEKRRRRKKEEKEEEEEDKEEEREEEEEKVSDRSFNNCREKTNQNAYHFSMLRSCCLYARTQPRTIS